MSEIKKLTERIIKFRDARDWKQFHKPKDLAVSLSLEAAEVLEHFQWKNEMEAVEYVKTHKDEIAEELADVLNYLLLTAYEFDIDIVEALNKKIDKSENKYPVEKAKGNAKKYTELEKL